MRKVIWVVFALAFLTLNFCLLAGLVSFDIKWSEAAFVIAPAALAAFICFVLLVAGVGAKPIPRLRAPHLWAAALLWSLLMGGIVIYGANRSYEYYMKPFPRAREVRVPGVYAGEPGYTVTRTYTAPYDEARGRDQRIGIVFGWTLLGFAGIAFVGLAASFALSKRAKPAPATT
jgi:hypothetical protein